MRCRPPNRRPGTSLVVSHERTLRLGELNWSSQHREHGVDFESAGDDIEILKRMDSMDDYGDAKPSFRRRAGRNREHGFGGPFHRAGSHVFHQVIFNPRPRSSADRASASGAVCAGSSPAEGAREFRLVHVSRRRGAAIAPVETGTRTGMWVGPCTLPECRYVMPASSTSYSG